MRTALLLCVVSLVIARGRARADEGRVVEVYAMRDDGTRVPLRSVDLDRLPQDEWTGPDPQYDVAMRMRGAPLEKLWRDVPVPAEADLALLRFDDGLLIPVAFRDADLMRRLRPRIIRANVQPVLFARLERGVVAVPRRPPTEEDLRPVVFHGNKVVVADARLAPTLPDVKADLAPWKYADSLHSIDFVRRASWEARFDAGPSTRAGQKVFLGTCVLCHAVRGAGGTMGWDFVDPYPIYSDAWMAKLGDDEQALETHSEERMSPKIALDIHVRFRAGGSGTRTMPALRGMRQEQVEQLWSWMQAVARRR